MKRLQRVAALPDVRPLLRLVRGSRGTGCFGFVIELDAPPAIGVCNNLGLLSIRGGVTA